MTRTAASTFASALAGLLAAVAFANGGRLTPAWQLCICGIALLSLIYWSRHEPVVHETRLTLLAVLPPLYVAVQLMPLPLPVLAILSPRRAEIAQSLGGVAPVSSMAPISVEPSSTMAGLMTAIVCVLCFLMVRELTWRTLRTGSWAAIFPLLVVAAFEGVFALWEAGTGDVVDGTFLNRNHLAGFLEMVLPLSVAYVLVCRRRDRVRSSPNTLRGFLWSLGKTSAPIILVVAVFAGVLASASKMGYVASLFGLFVMALAAAMMRLSGAARWLVLAALPILAIVGFTQLANQDVLVRLSGVLDSPDGLTGEGRLPIWADSLRLFAAYPLFGSGLGTYVTAFLGFQTTSVSFHWTHAHNDYIELAADLGIVGIVLFAGLASSIVSRALRLTRPTRQSGSDLAALGCLGAFAAIALHSVVDFNLTVPANMMLLAWIAGIASGIPPRQSVTPESKSSRIRIVAMMLSIVALAMASAKVIAGSPPPLPDAPTIDQLIDDLQRSPASPYRWLDLGEAFAKSGQTDQAKTSIMTALSLGRDVPPVIRRAATAIDGLGERRQGIALIVQGLRQSGENDVEAFDWLSERRIAAADVLPGLSSDRRSMQAYLRYLMLPGTCPEAVTVWHELIARHRADTKLAADYVNFLLSDCGRPDEAAKAWVDFGRPLEPDYGRSNLVFNGDFERDPASVPFDWQWNPRSDEAAAAIDAGQGFSGTRSLRMVFRGASVTGYSGAVQTVAVQPGMYRFTAAVKTADLKSADGVRFEITPLGPSPRVSAQTDQATGTTGWHMITADVVVPEGAASLLIQVVRRPGPGAAKEESLTGTAWVDAVTLSKVGSR